MVVTGLDRKAFQMTHKLQCNFRGYGAFSVGAGLFLRCLTNEIEIELRGQRDNISLLKDSLGHL